MLDCEEHLLEVSALINRNRLKNRLQSSSVWSLHVSSCGSLQTHVSFCSPSESLQGELVTLTEPRTVCVGGAVTEGRPAGCKSPPAADRQQLLVSWTGRGVTETVHDGQDLRPLTDI